MKSTESAFVGRWRTVEMEQWNQDFVDMEEPSHITFKKDGLGGFHFGCVDASLDWRYDDFLGRVDFTFEGFEEECQSCLPEFTNIPEGAIFSH